MKRIKGAFTIEHVQVAKMIANGYEVEYIAKALHYSKQTIYRRIWDLYLRYKIVDGNCFQNSLEKRKGLFELLQKKHEAKTL